LVHQEDTNASLLLQEVEDITYTSSVDAYRSYVLGRQYAQRRTVADLQQAVTHYQQAVALDARYALAYAGLADVYMNLAARSALPAGDGRTRARTAADTAVRLDPDLAEAQAAVGQMLVFAAPYDFANGDRALARAIALSPGSPIGYQYLGVSLIEQGRLDEGLKAWETARELDPLSPFIGHLVPYGHFLKRDYQRALALQRQANQLGPPFSTHQTIEIYLQNGANDEALREIDRLMPGREQDPYLLYARAMAIAGQDAVEARALMARLADLNGVELAHGHLIARIAFVLGDRNAALDWLERTLSADGLHIFHKDAPLWDPVRDDDRFARFMRSLRLDTR
jgi:serine/threonine-protein kinase